MQTTTNDPRYVTVAPLPSADDAVEIVAILDRSGSMGMLAAEVINKFNSFLAEQQALEGEARMTLVLFDDKYEVPVVDTDIKQVKPLDSTTYVPRNMTALYDALGKALTGLFARSPKRAIVLITTDGLENASREFGLHHVKELTSEAERRGYQVHYTAANQDAFAVGASMNILRTATVSNDAQGVADTYTYLSASTTAYRQQ